MPKGFILAAPHSGSGKTTITLGLLRHVTNAGLAVTSAKAGPDFIDPQYHAAATRGECMNLDAWAMRPSLIQNLAKTNNETLVVEAMMGLFDGAADGTGSAAELAALLSLPVVLVVDTAKQSHSIAALVKGFVDFRADIEIAGVILNNVGSARHETMLREALLAIDVPVLGSVRRHEELALPDRHLGLLQAAELPDLERFLDRAARLIGESLDVNALFALERKEIPAGDFEPIKPLGQRIAIARDEAFAFCYPHLLSGWKEQGASLSFFSPLDDEAPDESADAVYLPGGYPELHAGRLTGNQNFLSGVQRAAAKEVFVYGECGGYMLLGDGLVDRDGASHPMLGLLPLTTSFAEPKLSLGYRVATSLSDLPVAKTGQKLAMHEFHYSFVEKEDECDRLFAIEDARGQTLGTCGMVLRNVAGSYMHLIDRRA